MPKQPERWKPVVSLISAHPLVVPQLTRFLSRRQFTLRARFLDLESISELDRLKLPRASVYVVDAACLGATPAALTAAIRKRYPDARLIFLAHKFSEALSLALVRLGAKGLMSYADAPRQLPQAVRHLASGGLWLPRTVINKFFENAEQEHNHHQQGVTQRHLSRREQEVYEALLQKLSNKEISTELHISVSTVKFHVSNLLAKFGVRRRLDLILQGFQEPVKRRFQVHTFPRSAAS